MPTGYTAYIEDGKINDAKDFLMLCLRAFGVCMEMRDDSFSKPIPEKFVPSDYYSKSAERTQKEINELLNTSDETLEAKMVDDKNKNIDRCNKAIKENLAKKKSYQSILSQINNWNPQQKYLAVKEFATNQIIMSMEQLDNSYYEKEICELNSSNISIVEYRAMLLKSLGESLSYAAEHLQHEIKNVEEKNSFLSGFRESISEL